MKIKLEGLSSKQKLLADCIWRLDTWEDVGEFVQGLTKGEARDANLIIELFQLAILDEVQDTDLAKQVLDQYRI